MDIPEPERRVLIMPDLGLEVMDQDGTPMLTWGPHMQQVGWKLWYLDEKGRPDIHFVGGTEDDFQGALARARIYLREHVEHDRIWTRLLRRSQTVRAAH